MTVTVMLAAGGTVKYTRFGDRYVRRNDGTLDVFRGGAKRSQNYALGQWIDVEGDEKSWKHGRFWG